jgi:hypothetical protein
MLNARNENLSIRGGIAKRLSLFFTFLPYTYYDKFISVNQTRKGVLDILRDNILDFVSKGV